MSTARAVYDIKNQEALQNNISSVTYRNIKNTPTIQIKTFIDADIIPKLQSALRRHSSIKLTLGCTANLLKNEEIVQYLFRNKTVTINANDIIIYTAFLIYSSKSWKIELQRQTSKAVITSFSILIQ